MYCIYVPDLVSVRLGILQCSFYRVYDTNLTLFVQLYQSFTRLYTKSLVFLCSRCAIGVINGLYYYEFYVLTIFFSFCFR